MLHAITWWSQSVLLSDLLKGIQMDLPPPPLHTLNFPLTLHPGSLLLLAFRYKFPEVVLTVHILEIALRCAPSQHVLFKSNK